MLAISQTKTVDMSTGAPWETLTLTALSSGIPVDPQRCAWKRWLQWWINTPRLRPNVFHEILAEAKEAALWICLYWLNSVILWQMWTWGMCLDVLPDFLVGSLGSWRRHDNHLSAPAPVDSWISAISASSPSHLRCYGHEWRPFGNPKRIRRIGARGLGIKRNLSQKLRKMLLWLISRLLFSCKVPSKQN